MMRGESVLCATCGREFTAGLLELVRLARKPAECEACREARDGPPRASEGSGDAEVA
jgi:hypothetical protein